MLQDFLNPWFIPTPCTSESCPSLCFGRAFTYSTAPRGVEPMASSTTDASWSAHTLSPTEPVTAAYYVSVGHAICKSSTHLDTLAVSGPLWTIPCHRHSSSRVSLEDRGVVWETPLAYGASFSNFAVPAEPLYVLSSDPGPTFGEMC